MSVKKKRENVNIEFPDQKIVPINMEKEVRKSFIEYSMSVIVSRALPDARDGMKPSQRRILYAMYEDNLTSDRPFRKSATTVGNVLGRYHPHGDSSVYLAMVRMAQPFNYRYLLVDGHGNFGSVDGDGPAAYRYTEARLSKLSNEMMRDIEKDVIKWDMNFDNTRREPSVLPSRFPNLLINGSVGIAVGMATNIPPHNLGEVIDGSLYMMDHPDCTTEDLMQFIKGPDFPTGAEIYGTAGIIEAYKTGRGRIMVRAKSEFEEDNHRIIFTEIPYAVQKSDLLKNMADQVNSKRIEGVTAIRDESGRDGMRIVVDCRRDASLQVVLNQFYKYTELQSTFAANMLAIDNGEPKLLTLRDILRIYINHQESVIRKRTEFDLNKALKEAHIFEGYKTAIDHIDEVISIIRGSADQNTAKQNLRDRFALSEEQAQAIVQMTLGRLSGLERQKIEDRLTELYSDIERFRAILADENRIKQIIKDEMTEIKDKYSDERRTAIKPVENEIVPEDLIERGNAVITLSHEGYIKRQPADTYRSQTRGGKGIIGATTKDEDYIERLTVADTHSNLLLFTSTGRVHVMKTYRIPEAARTAKGTNIINLIDITPGEKITAMLSVGNIEDADVENETLIMLTRNGVIKRTSVSEFAFFSKVGKIAITLDEGDELIYVNHVLDEDVVVATKNGQISRYVLDKVRTMGRTSRGVKAISLRDGDSVIGAAMVKNDAEWAKTHRLLCVTENGMGKRIEIDDIPVKGRGGLGVIGQKVTEKSGALAAIEVVNDDDDVLLITNDGTIIRMAVEGISILGRTASGVILMRVSEDAKVVSVTVTQKTEEKNDENDSSENASSALSDPSSLADVEAPAISGGDTSDSEITVEDSYTEDNPEDDNNI